MQTHPIPKANATANNWEPISDVPENLEPDGRNYIEWAWSLLDDGIEFSSEGSFSTLKTRDGPPLLAGFAAECKAPNVDSGGIADDLIQLFFRDKAAAVARAKSLGEICDVAEDFCKAAIYLKFDLAADKTLPKAVRDALNGPVEVP